MNYIKSMDIQGFKKFYSLHVEFNEHMNILVGENEAGKSTILDAIKTVLNQQYRNTDKSIIGDLLNKQMVEEFRQTPSIKTLPFIVIEVEFVLDPKRKNAQYFFGQIYGERQGQEERYGIRFECKFDEELGAGLEGEIAQGKIPYEYYMLTWNTFANLPYQPIKRPLQFLSIDTTSSAAAPSFNYYNRSLFNNKYDEATRMRAKNTFRDKVQQALDEVDLEPVSENRRFGIDSKKIVLETVLSVYEESIALENRGSGMESLIKTQIALDRSNGLNVILMEEPENHLCFTNLSMMLQQISNREKEAQIIITTHNNMIASRLNLNNVLWIAEGKVQSLKDVKKDTAEFFTRADDNAFLQLLLSKKTILVEGPTEYLLLPMFYKQIMERTIEDDGIVIIPCNGISFGRYLQIAAKTQKKVAVITDNDKKKCKIEKAKEYNKKHELRHIFTAESVDEWTWEICIYKSNQSILDRIIQVKDGADYLFNGEDYGRIQGKMLNSKVDVAYQMLTSGEVFEVPQYVEEAIKWISE